MIVVKQILKALAVQLPFFLLFLGTLGSMVALGACAVATKSTYSEEKSRLDSSSPQTPLEDQLTLMALRLNKNRTTLETIRHDLDLIGAEYPFLPGDDQLGYIQKASLHIGRSILSATHQGEMLAILPLVNKAHKAETEEILVSGLRRAVASGAQDTTFLITSETFLEDRGAVGQMRKALSVIQDNLDCYRELIDLFGPPEESYSPQDPHSGPL
jgi:hypothetical protein